MKCWPSFENDSYHHGGMIGFRSCVTVSGDKYQVHTFYFSRISPESLTILSTAVSLMTRLAPITRQHLLNGPYVVRWMIQRHWLQQQLVFLFHFFFPRKNQEDTKPLGSSNHFEWWANVFTVSQCRVLKLRQLSNYGSKNSGRLIHLG